jgi:hypothetical protein
MPIAIRVSPELRFYEAVLVGDITIEDLRSLERDLAAMPGFATDFNAIIDLRGVTSLMGTDDLRNLAMQAKGRSVEHRSRRAILTSEDVMFGLVRMFEAHAEGSPTVYRAFRSLTDALKFLDMPMSDLRLVRPEGPAIDQEGRRSPANGTTSDGTIANGDETLDRS